MNRYVGTKAISKEENKLLQGKHIQGPSREGCQSRHPCSSDNNNLAPHTDTAENHNSRRCPLPLTQRDYIPMSFTISVADHSVDALMRSVSKNGPKKQIDVKIECLSSSSLWGCSDGMIGWQFKLTRWVFCHKNKTQWEKARLLLPFCQLL